MESQLQGWMESYKRQGHKTRSVWLIQSPCTFYSLETAVERRSTCETTGEPSGNATRSIYHR
eukprot:4716492-Amphidinium_carterae.1